MVPGVCSRAPVWGDQLSDQHDTIHVRRDKKEKKKKKKKKKRGNILELPWHKITNEYRNVPDGESWHLRWST